MRGGWTYILANRKNGALYVGVTADLPARMMQHRDGSGSAFCRQHGISRLVHMEWHGTIEDAIAREKALKKWRRTWKIALIEDGNPDWHDRWFELNGSEMDPRFRGDDASQLSLSSRMTLQESGLRGGAQRLPLKPRSGRHTATARPTGATALR